MPRLRTTAVYLAVVSVVLLLAGAFLQTGSGSESEHRSEAPAPPTVTMPQPVPSDAAPIDGPSPGGSATVELTSLDRQREFLLSVPDGYTEGERWPVLFAFHGWGENVNQTHAYTGFDRARALVVYPAGVDYAWEGAPYARVRAGEDQQFVSDILASLRATYSVDDSRIFATGFSNGGGFAALLGCRMNEEFAGVASVSAAYYDTIFRNCDDSPIAMLDIHGTDDPVIDYFGGTRHGAEYASVGDVLAATARRNECDGTSHTSRINEWALRQDWTGCSHPLSHIRVGAGGHVWPGAQEDTYGSVPEEYATEQILQFFGITAQ